MTLPKVSCYCATYGRPWALEESVMSFLKQDYEGEKELVILNDYRDHTLHYQHPEITIINVPNRIVPLGKKFNETVSFCTGDVLLPWEDDDVFLPNRIRYSVENMQNGFYHNGFAWAEGKDGLVLSGNFFHCNMAFSRDLWKLAGGYAEIDECILDIDFMAHIRKAANLHTMPILPEDIFYVYRWGTSQSYHASGWGGGVNVSEGAAAIVETQAAKGLVPKGPYMLKPYWSYDYVEAARKACAIMAFQTTTQE